MKVFDEVIEEFDIALSWRGNGEFPQVCFLIYKFVVVAGLADESITEFVVKEGTGVNFGELGFFFV